MLDDLPTYQELIDRVVTQAVAELRRAFGAIAQPPAAASDLTASNL